MLKNTNELQATWFKTQIIITSNAVEKRNPRKTTKEPSTKKKKELEDWKF